MPMQPKTEQEKVVFFLQLIIDFATANNNQRPTIQDIQEVLELEGQPLSVAEVKHYGQLALEEMSLMPQVRTSNANFDPFVIRIKKGESLKLFAETAASHVVANGAWENGTLRLSQEWGAPVAHNLQVKHESPQTIGPFNTTGSFKFCSTMRPGMNLTVTVSE